MKAKYCSLIVIIASLNGCYVSQHDNIDYSFNKEIVSLDEKCISKNETLEPSKWCKSQYRYLERKHERDIRCDNELVATSNQNSIIATVVIVSMMIIGATSIAVASHKGN